MADLLSWHKVERLFTRQLRQALDADHAFTLAYLQRPA